MLGQLKVMVYASRHIDTFLRKRKKLDASRISLLHRLSDVNLLESWAPDLLRVSGKFGIHLLQDPTVIYRIIPAFCPSRSMVYHYGKRSSLQVSVTGITDAEWEDRLARVSVGSSHKTSAVLCYGKYLAVSTLAGYVFIWNTTTFQELLRLVHRQHIFKMSFSNSGEFIAVYGMMTTTIWNTTSGQRLYTLSNITSVRPLCMVFADNDSMIIIASDTRKLLRSRLEAKPIASTWEVFKPNIMEEKVSIPGAFLNSPTDIAFNPDLTELAVAYRGFPLTIWSLDDEQLISRCKRRVEPRNVPQKTWTGVNRICWHPTSGNLLGIYIDGVVFQWHHMEETHEELKVVSTDATPSEIACSPEGTVFATSDVNGTIRLYSFQNFTMVYQLSSEDIVTALCFAPDGRRFYDLRGSFCDAWEPNALSRLSVTEERALDMETEASSTVPSLSNTEAFADAQVAITALAVGSNDVLIYTGNEEGLVELIDMDCKKVQAISASGGQICIDHLACSQDGTSFAHTNLEGKLVVLTREKTLVGLTSLKTYRAVLEVELESALGPMNELLSSHDSSHLLVAGQGSAQVWKTAERPMQLNVKWLNHPCRSTEVLAISPTTIYAYNWWTLEMVHQWSLILPKDDAVITSDHSDLRPSLSRNSTSQSAFTTLGQASLAIEDIITSQNRKSLIITISTPDLEKKRHPKTYILDTELLRYNAEKPCPTIELRSLPSAIDQSLLKPLAMLDPDRLIFLDTSFWVCTWRVGNLEGPVEAKVVRHYFLPTDWVTSGSLSLCRMLTDGSLVVARGKEVAVLRSAVATDW
jgi:WD40 repeat protein